MDLGLPDAPNGEIVDFVLDHNIPAIVLTGKDTDGLRKKILNKGVLDYFIKDNISVIDSVIYFIERTRKNQDIKVLVVDDSRSVRYILNHCMNSYGFQVLEAKDGNQALEILKKETVQIVITDYEMPNMDGFELTKRIKSDTKYSHLQVIALTSLASEAHIEKGRKVGIDEYEIKLDREKLMKVIRQYLNLK